MFIAWDILQGVGVENVKSFGHDPEVSLLFPSNTAFADNEAPQAVPSPVSEESCRVQPGGIVSRVWFLTLFRNTSGFEAFLGALSGLSRQSKEL